MVSSLRILTSPSPVNIKASIAIACPSISRVTPQSPSALVLIWRKRSPRFKSTTTLPASALPETRILRPVSDANSEILLKEAGLRPILPGIAMPVSSTLSPPTPGSCPARIRPDICTIRNNIKAKNKPPSVIQIKRYFMFSCLFASRLNSAIYPA